MLTNSQKRYLSQLAERAFNMEAAKCRAHGLELFDATKLSRSAALATFRHHHVAEASGKHGLRCCSQMDYKAVEAHFLKLLGETEKAQRAELRAATEPQRQAENKIIGLCHTLGKKLPYADGICRQMFHGLPLSDASVKQLWKVFFALKYEVDRQKKKAFSPQFSALS